MNTTNNFKPILFSTEMVQAILAGRKTQTRRITVDWDQHKPKFIISGQGMYGDKYPKPSKYMAHFRYPEESTDSVGLVAPIQPGDILWVRETFGTTTIGTMYKANVCSPDCDKPLSGWKPSLLMPKEAARIFLKVTNVRCERLNDISEEDAIAEGIIKCFVGNPTDFENSKMRVYRSSKLEEGNVFAIDAFKELWQSINAKKHPWKSNPWVWVYDFERIEKPENFN